MKQFNTDFCVFMLTKKGIPFGRMIEMENEILDLIISKEIFSMHDRFECPANYKGAGFLVRDKKMNRFYQCFIQFESTPKDQAKLPYIWKIKDLKTRNIINRINGVKRFF